MTGQDWYPIDKGQTLGTEDGGLGLGLAISKGIIEQHQGQVGVESAPGQGATFWFSLPLADQKVLSTCL